MDWMSGESLISKLDQLMNSSWSCNSWYLILSLSKYCTYCTYSQLENNNKLENYKLAGGFSFCRLASWSSRRFSHYAAEILADRLLGKVGKPAGDLLAAGRQAGRQGYKKVNWPAASLKAVR